MGHQRLVPPGKNTTSNYVHPSERTFTTNEVSFRGSRQFHPESDSEPIGPITNLPIYNKYNKERKMLKDTTEM
jgi:hypothetical protein